jgi:trans-aconitate methyltransferase
MDIDDAAQLIGPGLKLSGIKQSWADLGCGKGLFTRALARLLAEGSVVHAVDQVVQHIESGVNGRSICFHRFDFIRQHLPLDPLDGIVMANSLHFVEDKTALLSRLKHNLKPQGQLLIVEYDLAAGNQWVPFPIRFRVLQTLLSEQGFNNIRKIGERNSVYGNHKMYALTSEVSG